MARKRGRRADVNRLVGAADLIQIEGLGDVIANIAALVDRFTVKRLKQVYIEASKPVWSQAKRNIDGLPVSPELKEVLHAMTMINTAAPDADYVLMGMSQQAGIKKLGRTKEGNKRMIPNPYWFEFGTANRATSKRATGKINATPFFRPALEAKKREVKAVLEQELKKLLEEGLPTT